jgi:hypothetical protein
MNTIVKVNIGIMKLNYNYFCNMKVIDWIEYEDGNGNNEIN